jgi:LuxR family quorum-sensing system transcriptional regulator SolR
MDTWREDFFNAFLNLESEQEVLDLMAEMARAIGFEYCAYGIQMPVPVSRPKVAMVNNYSPEWQAHYQQRGYLHIDPTVQHALKSTLPVVWSQELFKSAQDMWEEAHSYGLRVGWAQSSRDAFGCVGLLTLARSAGQLTASELQANQAKMTWFTQHVHVGMSRLLIPKMAPETQILLTAREKEVLRWTAEGKTAYEISLILAISERTVNFHINNVVLKLGASNKTQAAVKAVALGLLF